MSNVETLFDAVEAPHNVRLTHKLPPRWQKPKHSNNLIETFINVNSQIGNILFTGNVIKST
ncbi:MAG: hypothetical protein UX74_C0012G0009 [Parcubacteria group bacterium GW2011_GWA2_47_10b]|nr:MAG: hypothetical protein UX74_C0012G0009 [Parcubacteria group bacterium GW2011_GWA2_47_10b]